MTKAAPNRSLRRLKPTASLARQLERARMPWGAPTIGVDENILRINASFGDYLAGVVEIAPKKGSNGIDCDYFYLSQLHQCW